MQPKVERPNKERSRRYIAPNYLPGYRPIDPEHDLVRFQVYAFKNNIGLHGRCFSLEYLADTIVDGNAGAISAAKKKARVQVVLSPFALQLPVNACTWQYVREERTLRPRVACTTVIMEVEGEEVERQGRKVFQVTAECKSELEQKGFRPRELEDEEEAEGDGARIWTNAAAGCLRLKKWLQRKRTGWRWLSWRQRDVTWWRRYSTSRSNGTGRSSISSSGRTTRRRETLGF
jgi:hypothetical protein